MNVKLFTILSVLILYSTSFSDSLQAYRPLKHSFQLQIGDYLALKTFENTWVSYKMHFSTNKAIRIGLNLNIRYDGNYSPKTSSSSDFKDISKGAGLTINSYYISYFYFDKVIKPYYGIGPYFSTSYSGENKYLSGWSFEYDRRTSYDVGLNGMIGLEWFFHKNFSLFTEYSLKAGFSYYTAVDDVNSKRTNKNYRLSSNNCLIGLSIYL